MLLSEKLFELLGKEFVFHNGKYYSTDDNGELLIFTTNQAISLVEQLLR